MSGWRAVSPALSVLHWQRVRKWVSWRPVLRYLTLLSALSTATVHGQLAESSFERAEADVARIKTLVEQGTLPKASLDQAEERLADARDQLTLSDTLYGTVKAQDMTGEQADQMLAAASRRVDRAAARLEERRKFLEMGIISQAEMGDVKNELNSRQLVLDLARSRVNLLSDLRRMAAEEQSLQLAAQKNVMIRHDGLVAFKLSDLPAIEKDFKDRFHQDLPVSALGQTAVHQAMGLDHRNKVDVALNPDQPEGLWLRHYLEKHNLSYLAFRMAVSGAATGAHIHIGSGSGRLALAAR